MVVVSECARGFWLSVCLTDPEGKLVTGKFVLVHVDVRDWIPK